MKLIKNMIKSYLPKQEANVVELIAVVGGWKSLDSPTLSSDLCCPICSGIEHYTPYSDVVHDQRRVWICANGSCGSNNRINMVRATPILPKLSRSIVWAEFCEINAIGDKHLDVKFEDVNQSDGKKSYMLKFSESPDGLILMRGDPGTGKTFSAMAICELFTRKSTSCYFMTQKQMNNKWLDAFNNQGVESYSYTLTNVNLLVIDDFGTADMSPNFMSFFMDIINTRMQWKNRGTVITTNLSIKKLNEFCGEALADRLMTGQQFEFKGESRRKKTIL